MFPFKTSVVLEKVICIQPVADHNSIHAFVDRADTFLKNVSVHRKNVRKQSTSGQQLAVYEAAFKENFHLL